MVEAPGTAPGSEWLIAESIYRRSRTNPAHTTYDLCANKKRASRLGRVISYGLELDEVPNGREQGALRSQYGQYWQAKRRRKRPFARRM